jgi:TonB family protein
MFFRALLALLIAWSLAGASPAGDDDPPIPTTGPGIPLHKVEPVYPPEAVRYRIEGTVRFTVIVGKDGSVEDARLVSGHPLLISAARTAVKQWIFKPAMIGGRRVRFVTNVAVPFRLGPYGSPPSRDEKQPDKRASNAKTGLTPLLFAVGDLKLNTRRGLDRVNSHENPFFDPAKPRPIVRAQNKQG